MELRGLIILIATREQSTGVEASGMIPESVGDGFACRGEYCRLDYSRMQLAYAIDRRAAWRLSRSFEEFEQGINSPFKRGRSELGGIVIVKFT
jgi:hypothetical protein